MQFVSTTKQVHRPFAHLIAPSLAALFATYALAFVAPAHAAPTIKAYLSAPNTQSASTTITNTTVTTFNGETVGTKTYTALAPFSSGISSYTGTYAIVADDNYGAGTGNYFSFGAQSGSSTPVTLTFSTAIQYFGLSYNAGDVNNGFTFYDASNNAIGRYSTAMLISALNGGQGTVTATDNKVYNSSQFYGKPNGLGPGSANTGTNNTEPYGFLNFFVSGGSVKKIVFDNSGQSTGFESDNHTVSTVAQTLTGGSFVFVGNADTPEASTLALLFSGLPILAGSIGAKKRLARRNKKA